jgi:hypothetical protein
LALFQLIQAQRSNPDVTDSAALKWADDNDLGKSFRSLLADLHQDDATKFALQWKRFRGHPESVQPLLSDSNVDVTQFELDWSCRNGHTGVVQALLTDKEFCSSVEKEP